MTFAIRVAWFVYGIYALLLAIGSFSYSLVGALAFWGAAVAVVAHLLTRSTAAAYIAAALIAFGPLVVDTGTSRPFGAVYLATNLLVAIVLAWLAHVAQRRRLAQKY